MKWVDSLGGPFLLIERSLLANWGGNVRSFDRSFKSDYEKACAISDYLGCISVNAGMAVVLSSEPLPTALWPLEEGGTMIVRQEWAKSDMEIDEHLTRLPAELSEIGPTIEYINKDRHLMLFDSVLTTEHPYFDALEMELDSGPHKISTYSYEPDEETSLILHKIF